MILYKRVLTKDSTKTMAYLKKLTGILKMYYVGVVVREFYLGSIFVT